MSKKTVIVGDVHGCLEELLLLLDKVHFRALHDRLILLGDLVDRGPDSAGVVHFARMLEAEVILGNHEEKYVRWRRHERKKLENPGYKNPMRSFGDHKKAVFESLSDDDIDWMETLPRWLRINEGLVAVHAGLEPGKPVEEQDDDRMIRLRYLAPDGSQVSLDKDLKPPPGSVFWTSLWTGPESVVYGHDVASLEYPVIEEPRPGIFTFGLDTGCCFGGKLSALVIYGESWEDARKEIVQVNAARVYWSRDRRA